MSIPKRTRRANMPQCPGRFGNLHLESTLLSCPECGRTVEIFNDEGRFHCRCGAWVFREAVPSCAQWCEAAERCFGKIGLLAKAFKDAKGVQDQAEQEKRLKELRERIAAAQANCPVPESKRKEHDTGPSRTGLDDGAPRETDQL